MKNFIAECRRRRVFRMAALYIVGAWIVLQVADLALQAGRAKYLKAAGEL